MDEYRLLSHRNNPVIYHCKISSRISEWFQGGDLSSQSLLFVIQVRSQKPDLCV